MGLQASIDIFFNKEIVFKDFIENMCVKWTLNDFGVITYMDNDDFDWKSERLDKKKEIIDKLDKRFNKNYTVGIVFVDKYNSGGIFLFCPSEKSLSFIININRKKIGGANFTDFSYYIQKLSLILSNNEIWKIECCDIV